MKNTFNVLRAKLRDTQNKLNCADRIVALQLQELERLRSAIRMQDSQIVVLNNQLETEANRTVSLTNSLMETKEDKDYYYEQWMKDHSKIKIWKKMYYIGIGLNILSLIFNITAIAFMLEKLFK